MEYTSVQKLARVLKIVIIILFVCNILALLIVAGLIRLSYSDLTNEWEGMGVAFQELISFFQYEVDDAMAHLFYAPFNIFGQRGSPYERMLTVFLWVCGTCTAVVLWQGKRVVESIINEDTFSLANAANMKRAAICCFIISGAALIRLIWSIAYAGGAMMLVSYNTLFIPVFIVAGLICMVMSALFRQAAEMKAENDLTI